MFKQKDIVLMKFPYTDLTGMKLRPALIISNKKTNKDDDRICCLITSNPNAKGIAITHNELDEGKIHFDSLIKPQRLFTVHKSIIQKKIATLNKNTFNEVIKQIESCLE